MDTHGVSSSRTQDFEQTGIVPMSILTRTMATIMRMIMVVIVTTAAVRLIPIHVMILVVVVVVKIAPK